MVSMEVAGNTIKPPTARGQGLLGCTRCGRVWRPDATYCGRCGQTLQSRDGKSLQRVWAWWIAGVVCYIPANLDPMLRTRTLVQVEENTILGGVIELMHHGSYGIAFIIFVASIIIPLGKFMAIAILALGVGRQTRIGSQKRQVLYEVVEYIGRWSMIDVFVVAILSSLVQLNVLAAVNPGRASLYFALSVIFTMLSAQSFDSRLIWDTDPDRQTTNPKEPTP
ncbi:paraquat-inducible protein A [Aliiroseovarius sp. YM-037]|uniref:paraquat-inducible protein A n=1 Tax=Aliiroseovarius sp. YM-037 TaxID=3341728 RepID=UPI003A807D5B